MEHNVLHVSIGPLGSLSAEGTTAVLGAIAVLALALVVVALRRQR